MPRQKNAPNKSYYHYRLDTYNKEDDTFTTQRFYTMNEMCEVLGTSSFTCKKLIKDKEYIPNNPKLHGIMVFKEKFPVYSLVKNEI